MNKTACSCQTLLTGFISGIDIFAASLDLTKSVEGIHKYKGLKSHSLHL